MKTTEIDARGIRFSEDVDGLEVGRAHLYIMHNELHKRPFGLMEDVYVNPDCQGQGIGSRLVNELIATAEREGCYKLIATSRHERDRVHSLYIKLGFSDRGTEFRMNF